MSDLTLPEGISLTGHVNPRDRHFVSVTDLLTKNANPFSGFTAAIHQSEDLEERDQSSAGPSSAYLEALQQEAHDWAKQGYRYTPPQDVSQIAQRQAPPRLDAPLMPEPSAQRSPPPMQVRSGPQVVDWATPQPKQALLNPNPGKVIPAQGEEGIKDWDTRGAIGIGTIQAGADARAQRGQSPIPPGQLRKNLDVRQEENASGSDTARGVAFGGLERAGVYVPQELKTKLGANVTATTQIIKFAAQNLQMDFSGYTDTDAFSDPDMDPVFLDLMLLRSWGQEWFSWDPMTLRSELKTTFGVTASRRLMDKVLAVQTVHTSDRPYQEWEVFMQTAAALTNHIVTFGNLPELSPAEAAYAAATMQRLRRSQFSPQVVTYWSALCLNDGLIVPPAALSQALPLMKQRVSKTHPEMLQEIEKILQFMEKGWAPVGEDTVVDEQLRRLRAMEMYCYTRMAGRPAMQG